MNAASEPRPDPAMTPVFCVGPQRAGSTIFRGLLNAHPDVAVPRHVEIDAAARHLAAAGDGSPSLESYVRRLRRSDRFAAHGNLVDPNADTVVALARSFLDQSARRCGTPVIGATVHQDFDQLVAIWPRARYIYLVRDPRAVAQSVVKRGWAANYATAVDQWVRCADQLARLRQVVEPAQVLVIRFEDLVAQPTDTLGRVWRFLGVPSEHVSTAEPSGLDASRVDAWRHEVSSTDQRVVMARTTRERDLFGYAEAGLRPELRVGARTVFTIDEMVARVRHRRRRRILATSLMVSALEPLSPARAEDLRDRVDGTNRLHGEDRHRVSRSTLLPASVTALLIREPVQTARLGGSRELGRE